MTLNAAILIILNTIAAVVAAWLIYTWTVGSQLAVNAIDQPYFIVSAGLSAFIGSLIILRPALHFSLKEKRTARWIGVCLLNIAVVLITHLGAGGTLALRRFWRYHEYMSASSDTYVFDWVQGPLMNVLLGTGFSVVIFWPVTIPAGILVSMVWLFLYRRCPQRKIKIWNFGG